MTGGINAQALSASRSRSIHTPAIVLDGEQRSALAVTRSLGRRGVPVWVADTSLASLASSSRFAHGALAYPDPTIHPEQFIDWLEALGQRHPHSVLFPLTDVTVPLVLRATARTGSLLTSLPHMAAYEAASDKSRLLELARSVDILVPQTWSVRRESRDQLPRAPHFPVVIKPSRSATTTSKGIVKRSVRYASSQHEMESIVDVLLIDSDDELLIQEYVAGSGVGVFALYDHSTPLFFFSHRRLRERPPTGGVSVLSESAEAPNEGVSACRRLLEALEWHGVAMVEFKLDSLGRLWLMEINARLWGSLQLAVDCGADFPWWLYQLATGSNVTPSAHYEIGRRLRWWLGDLDNIYAQLRDSRCTPTFPAKMRAIGQFLLPWQPRMRYELLRFQDPRPAFVALEKYMRALRSGKR